MYKFIFTCIVYFQCHILFATQKDTITIAEITQKVKSGKTDSLYYGFDVNDEVSISLLTLGNKIKQVEIFEVRGALLYKAYKVDTNIQKTFKISKKCVLGIHIQNSSFLGKVYQLTVKRISNKKDKPFNSHIVWKPIFDTAFTTTYEQYVEKTDTIFENILDRTSRIHSQTSINFESNRQIVDFYLPADCIGWTYWISVGNEGKAAYSEAKKGVMKSLAGAANLIPEYGPLISLALNGVIALNTSLPGDNINYWFVASKPETEKFKQKSDFISFKQGNVVKDYGKMNAPTTGVVYIALLNDNLVEGIDVDLKVLAIRTKVKYGIKTIKKVNKITYRRTEPFNVY